MRPSRLRVTDLGQLLVLRYPVRCRSCLQRDFVSIRAAWKLHLVLQTQRIGS
jgi:hypothetical protein